MLSYSTSRLAVTGQLLSIGLLSIGLLSIGLLSSGLLSIGLLSIGLLSIGLLFSGLFSVQATLPAVTGGVLESSSMRC